jgi:DNA ligase (NAD+)
MNMSGLGPRLIEQLVDAGLLYTVVDIFLLDQEPKKQQLRSLPGIADKKIHQISQEIQHAKQQPFARVLAGLSIRHLGAVMAEQIQQDFFTRFSYTQRTVETWLAYVADPIAIAAIHGIGLQIDTAIKSYFADEDNQEVFRQLDALQVIQREDNTLFTPDEIHIYVVMS